MITIIKIIFIGLLATFAVDIWVFILNLFKIKSLDYRYVGRWIAYFPRGKFIHNDIMKTPPVRREIFLGWTAHYLIGITFAFILIIFFGTAWLEKPDLFSAIIIGIITAAAPLFVMQPAFGFGIASSKLPNPNVRRLKSLMTHIVYGIGLYSGGIILQQIWK